MTVQKTRGKTIDVWADTEGMAICKDAACGARIMWAEVCKSGKKMCFTGKPTPLTTHHDEGRLVHTYEFADNHWASCPGSKTFHGGRRGGKSDGR